MVKYIFTAITILVAAIPAFSQKNKLTGIVQDAETRQPLPGATILLAELHLSAVADSSGHFTILNTPKGHYLIEIRHLGYEPITENIHLDGNGTLTFLLHPALVETETVVVTGSFRSSESKRNSLVVTGISEKEIHTSPAANLIDALAEAGAISQITTGPAVSKPVIRGLSSNRVITLNNGVKQQGQQWGDEHGIEIDQFSTGRVEVLHGAASLMYGSDAIGGVINISDPVPPAPGEPEAEAVSQYQFNNGLTANSLMVGANHNGFVWRARGSYKNAFSYKTPDARVPNTGFEEANWNVGTGLYRSWGHSKLEVSRFNSKIGLPHIENDLAEEAGEDQIYHDWTRRDIELPFQRVGHTMVAWNNYIITGESHLRATLAFQQNERREFEDLKDEAALHMDLKSYSGNIRYFFKERKNWQPVIGFSGELQENKNLAEEVLIPEYSAVGGAVFAYLKKEWLQTTFSIGLRYDVKNLEANGQNTTPLENTFSQPTVAAGFTHQLTGKLSLKANTGTAFRAPNIAELASNGVHEGAFRYETGNPALEPEKSYYADAALSLQSKKLVASASLFANLIDNYIFLQNTGELRAAEGQNYPEYHYTQAEAILYGSELRATYHPVELLHLETRFSWTLASNRSTEKPLPFIPAASMKNILSFEPHLESKVFSESRFAIEMENTFDQNRAGTFETKTPGYTLFNLMAMISYKLKNNQELQLSVFANNLFDTQYISHLSRLKDLGFWNMGRNIGLGLSYNLN